MQSTQSFSEEVSQKLGYYVYRLIDPRNGETFYIGKGRGNRIFAHVRAFSHKDDRTKFYSQEEEDDTSAKISRIQTILNEGLEVIHIIHRHEVPKSAVFEVEAALIDVFSGLTNNQGGHGSNSRGPMNVEQIVHKYQLPELEYEPEDKLVLININRIVDKSDRDKIYDQTRFAWRIDQERAKKADFVLSVVRGVVIGVFVAHEWLPATTKYFPKFGNDANRYGFVGEIAPDSVWEKYVGARGKRVVNDKMKHIQYPIRYWRI